MSNLGARVPPPETLDALCKETYRPLIAVASSSNAKTSVGRNHVDPATLFEAFVNISPGRIQFSFLPLENCFLYEPKKAETILDEVCKKAAPSLFKPAHEMAVVDTKGAILRKIDKRQVVTPWLSTYRRALAQLLKFSKADYLDHPMGIVCVISTGDADPVNEAKRLLKTDNLPLPLKNRFYDLQFCCIFYLVIHDPKLNRGKNPEDVVKKLRRVFPKDRVRLLVLNRQTSEMEEQQDIFSPILADNVRLSCYQQLAFQFYDASDEILDPDSQKILGSYLSRADRKDLHDFVHRFLGDSILAHMDKESRKLQNLIDNSRNGFRNKVARLFGTRKQTSNVQDENTPRYYLNSSDTGANEAMVRFAADLYFLMQRYEKALTLYKSVTSDFKEDKAFVHLGSTYQMIGLCLAFRNPSDSHRREIEHYFDLAVQRFHRGTARRCRATWCAMLGAVYIESTSYGWNGDRIGTFFLRPSEKEQKTRGALLLEQAAYAFIKPSPEKVSQVRKYALHLLLCAHLYKQAEQHRHAVRCYTQALFVYQQVGWYHVEDHIHYNLGILCYKLDHYVGAIHHFLQLLQCDRGNTSHQSNFLTKFINIVKKWQYDGGSKLRQALGGMASRSITNSVKFVPKLCIPVFKDLEVVLTDHSTVPSSLADALWRNDSNSGLMLPCAVLEEPIIVKGTLVNPLGQELRVSNMMIHCEVEDFKSKSIVTYDELFKYDTPFENMPPQTSKEFQLTLYPSSELLQGFNVHLLGIRWQLFDVMQGYHSFKSKPKPEPLPLKHSALVHPPQKDRILSMIVVPPMPLLQCDFSEIPLPETMYKDEVALSILRIANAGSVGADSIMVKFSKPEMVAIHVYDDCIETDNILHPDSNGIVMLDQVLQPKEYFSLAVWICPNEVGEAVDIEILISYEALEVTTQEEPELAKDGSGTKSPRRIRRIQENVLTNLGLSVENFHKIDEYLRSEDEVEYSDVQFFLDTNKIEFQAANIIDTIYGGIECISSLGCEEAMVTNLSRNRVASVVVPPQVAASLNRRICRLNHTMKVLPLLSISHSMRPNRSKLEELILILRAECVADYLSPRFQSTEVSPLEQKVQSADPISVQLNSVIGLSQKWAIHDFVNSRCPEVESIEGRSASSIPLLIRSDQGEENSIEAERMLSSVELHTSGETCSKYASWKDLGEYFYKQRKNSSSARRKLFQLQEEAINPQELILLCSWHIPSPVPSFEGEKNEYMRSYRFGFSQLQPSPIITYEENTSCPLRLNVQHPKVVHNDFAKRRLKTVSITVEVLNCSKANDMSFVFETLPPEESFDRSSCRFQRSKLFTAGFLWLGNTRWTVEALRPTETRAFELTALFDTPGVYNLNRFRFYLKQIPANLSEEEKAKVPSKLFYFPIQHFVEVVDEVE